MEDIVENVAMSMRMVFEKLRDYQAQENEQVKRKVARSVELLRRKGIRMYREIDLDAQKTARISVADKPAVIDYSVFNHHLEQLGLPRLTSTNPDVLKARERVGRELYYLVAEASKIIASQRT